MERYDAILEQLKKAQSRGMETITNRLDFVVQSLEELIQEAKSSIQGALPDSADECLPVDEVKAALDGYRDEIDSERRRVAELETQLAEIEQTAAETPTGTSIELMRALDAARSQSELLKELLPAISEHAARAVVLVLRDGKVTAWSGIGFADGESLRSWQGDAVESVALTKLLEVARPVRFVPADDDLFQTWLAGEDVPIEVLLIPVVLRGKLMGTVYVDRLEGQPWAPAVAQTLVAQVCWLIDTLQYRHVAAASLAEPVGIDRPAEAPATSDEEAVPDVEIDEESAVVETGDVGAEPAAAEAGDAELEPGEPAPDHGLQEPEFDPSATVRIEVSDVAGGDAASEVDVDDDDLDEPGAAEFREEPESAGESFEPDAPVEPEFDAAPDAEFEPEPDGVAEDDAEQEPTGDEAYLAPPEPAVSPTEVQAPVIPIEVDDQEEETPEPEPAASRFLDEPPPVKPVQPPPDEPEEEVSEDEAQREEARRFARLLVSEIKLYNEEQVERGRETKDLYQRLQEDINRSREMFEKRISPEVRANQDYFQDELVRILADGDPDALGM
jgi:hypothetical protein